MANVLRNPGDLTNAALVRIGYGRQIGSLYDGSEAAQKTLSIYGQTRDAMMRDGDWQFAQRTAPLTLLKQAPANLTYLTPWTSAFPPLPWVYEYAWLDDMLKVRAVKPTPIFLVDPDPQPYVFSTPNDNSLVPPARVIVCNVADAICVYAARVTNPIDWTVDFVEAFIEELGKNLATGLTDIKAAGMEAAEGDRDTQIAKMEVG
jgi:hypothetical protein